MDSVRVTCQNCMNGFIVEPEDLAFYERVQVPPPSFCPECRAKRRLVWRNERTLYRRTCDLCKQNIISVYSAYATFPVYCPSCWWSDAWEASSYGQVFDFERPFFAQWRDLLESVPEISQFSTSTVNSDYCNYVGGAKNCYLITGGKENENCAYSNRISFSRDVYDCYIGNKLELCYACIQCDSCYQLFFSRMCDDCSDSWFLYDCKNCQRCFGCTGLRNAEYCFFNERLTKDEYLRRIREFNTGNNSDLEQVKQRFSEVYLKSIHKFAHLINCAVSTGDNLHNARNCRYCFDILGGGSENCKYCAHVVGGIKDCYDLYGAPKAELIYEALAIGFDSNENSMYRFSSFIRGSSFVTYSHSCHSSSNLFGCVGLKKKSYCILNKEYSKEEYENLVPRIVIQMQDLPYVDARGMAYRFGEYFPSELSPFAYNETIANEYYPLEKEEVIAQGFRFKDGESRAYSITKQAVELPTAISAVADDVVNEVIGCASRITQRALSGCTTAFRILPQELEFYRKVNVPLPRLCPNCRHYLRLIERNPMRLWDRECDCGGEYGGVNTYRNTSSHSHLGAKCPNGFETSYAPERHEIVYCEPCYQAEVA